MIKKKNRAGDYFSWMKYKKFFFFFSFVMIVISAFSLARTGLVIGIEFKGGAQITYQAGATLPEEQVKNQLSGQGIEISQIQKVGDRRYIFSMTRAEKEVRDKILTTLEGFDENVREIQLQEVGPSIGPELVKKTIYAILISGVAILLWVAYQFKSLRFGVSAILAMAHDSFILIGSFSLLGALGAEADFLFVTAVLTTLSFSVHDTIVVFDRIREIRKRYGGNPEMIANKAVSETMRRSLINSLTIVFMLLSLVILGGETVRFFAAALLIGAVLGTYSSPFVAVPLWVVWEKHTFR